jgi:ribosomal protein L11 methyltransferase
LTTKKGGGRKFHMKQWLVITLLIPRGLEEGISNFLIEQGATGIEEIDEDLKWERLKAYFLKDGKEKSVLRTLHRYLRSLQTISPEMPSIKIEMISIPEQDWGENWKKFFKPVQVGSRFVVKPPWSKTRLKKGQVPIVITPGMAFGTGSHATTKLCIQALEARLRKRGLSVLDVGTGSGILSIAAAKLGAGEVLGLDIDGVAVRAARENVRQNGVSDIVRIRKGRIGDIRRKFDIVVANIDHKSLRRMRIPLLLHLKTQGFLILSGILEADRDFFRQHYLKTNLLRWAKVTQEEEWVCLVLKKK